MHSLFPNALRCIILLMVSCSVSVRELPQLIVYGGATQNFPAAQRHFYLLGCPNSLIPFQSKTAVLWRIYVYVAGNTETYLGLLVSSWMFFFFNCNHIWRFLTYFPENPNIKSYGTSSSGSRADTCGHRDRQTDRQRDRRTDMTKLIRTCCDIANVPINLSILPTQYIYVFPIVFTTNNDSSSISQLVELYDGKHKGFLRHKKTNVYIQRILTL